MKDSNYSIHSWELPNPTCFRPLLDVELPLCIKAILIRRGYKTKGDVIRFLNPLTLPDPKDHFRDLGIAVGRLKKARTNKEIVAICGDYDADGMTSTALLIKALKEINIEVIAAIPKRLEDGYGLNTKMVSDLYARGVTVIITVDNGINAFEALDLANDYNIDVILTDHHEIGALTPSVFALLHPATTPITSPYRILAGVGIAYILAVALAGELRSIKAIKEALDLFCIGTIADMSPLIDSNRYLLIQGLKEIHKTNCEGLKSLYKLTGLGNRAITAEDIGFQLAPRINAVGRIGDPNLILDLLLESNNEKSIDLARKADEINRQRKELSKGIELEAIALVEADNECLPPFILIAQSHWHQGVIGIVAARLVERFNRPTALLASSNDGIFHASVRAPHGFSVKEALDKCANYLESYGGHPAAGGFKIKPNNIHKLHKQLIDIANVWFEKNGSNVTLRPDSYLRFDQISMELWRYLQQMEPFGIGNKKPLFWSRKCEVISKSLLRGGHLKLVLMQNGVRFNAVHWNFENLSSVPTLIDIAYHLNLNYWNNKTTFLLDIKDLRSFNKVSIIKRNSGRIYRCFIRDENRVVILNNKGKELSFYSSPPFDLISTGIIVQDKYILRLVEDAKVVLGLVH